MMNYKQLRYFWAVAKTGSIVRACEQLNLTPQTISGQIGLLEKTLGVELFRRAGRRLELTETGQLALSYAEEIFQVGGELEEALRTHPGGAKFCSGSGLPTSCPSPSPTICWPRR